MAIQLLRTKAIRLYQRFAFRSQAGSILSPLRYTRSTSEGKFMQEFRKPHFCRIAGVLVLGLAMTGPPALAQGVARQSSRLAFSHALPALNGKKLVVNVVEVTYAPGEASPPHSHPCPVIAYVADGEIRSQVEGQAESVFKAGDSFYEAPNGVHAVSGNASQTRPAKLLAIFVCDHAAPLSAPAKGPHK